MAQSLTLSVMLQASRAVGWPASGAGTGLIESEPVPRLSTCPRNDLNRHAAVMALGGNGFLNSAQ